MELTGLGLGQLALVFGGAGLATLTLYLLRIRRRRISVPYLPLWTAAAGQREANRLFAGLKHWLSFLLALFIVALLTLALGDPRPTRPAAEVRHRLLLIDASVTMQAATAGRSRLQEALQRAAAEIDALPAGDQMLLAQMDQVPTALSAMTDDRTALRDALQHVQASDLPLDPAPALALSGNLLRSRSRPEVVWISDFASTDGAALRAALARDGIILRPVAVGQAGRNVGVSAFAARRYPLDKSHSQAFVEVHNGNDQLEHVELTLTADGRTVLYERLEVPAKGQTHRVFDSLAGVDRRVQARVRLADGSADALGADDTGFALLPERRRARVLAVTDGNLYLQAALLLDEYLEVHTVAPENYHPELACDVAVFDGFVPSEPPRSPSIYLSPQARDGFPFAVKGTLEAPHFARIERRDPLLRFVALEDVNIARALHLELLSGDQAIGRGQDGEPLLVRGERAGAPMFALAFDVRDSDLPLRVAWPVLVIGMIDALVQTDVAYQETSLVGERVTLQVPEGVVEGVVDWPDGTRGTLAAHGGALQLQARRAGFAAVSAGSSTRLLAFNLHPSTPRSVTAPRAGAATEPTADRPGALTERLRGYPPWLWLIAAAAALLSLEWFSYQRRWTL